MTDNRVIALPNPEEGVKDVLTEGQSQGARRILAEAIESEVETFLAHYAQHRDGQDRRLVVRNGHLPERTIQTGIGDVTKVPPVHDCSGHGPAPQLAGKYRREQFSTIKEQYLAWGASQGG